MTCVKAEWAEKTHTKGLQSHPVSFELLRKTPLRAVEILKLTLMFTGLKSRQSGIGLQSPCGVLCIHNVVPLLKGVAPKLGVV